MSSSRRNSVVVGVLALFGMLALSSCSSAPPPPKRTVYQQPEPVFVPPIQTPQCFDEGYYVGVYSTAREFEVAYFQNKDTTDGTKAIDLFASYLECAPSGSYAMSAHLRKARLHCAMGNVAEGRDALRRLSEHPQAGGTEVIDAKYVYDYCQGVVDFRGRPLPRDSAGRPPSQ